MNYYGSDKKVIQKYTTDKNGEIIIKDLKIGKYYLKETKENSRYYSLKENIEIKIEEDKTTTVIVGNEAKKGQIRIIKVDKNNNEIRLEGVEFEILDKNGNILETIITNKNGEAVTSKYAVRDYEILKIREKQTIENYKLSEEIIIVKIEEDKMTDVIVENEPKEPELPEEPEQPEEPNIPEMPEPIPELPKLPRTGF